MFFNWVNQFLLSLMMSPPLNLLLLVRTGVISHKVDDVRAHSPAGKALH